MSEAIKVHVIKYPGRKNLMMRFRDPATGKQIARSTGTTKRRDAERLALKWEAELREGRGADADRMPWPEFRQYYSDNVAASHKAGTAEAYDVTLRVFTRLCRPRRVGDINTTSVAAMARELRKAGRSEATVARHLRHLKAIARWANRQGLLSRVPQFDMPKKADGARTMKGRPITLEEFERMLAKVESVVGPKAADSWRFLLRGLWTSGLRLGEALALRWDLQPGGVSVELNDDESVLNFDGGSQKSGKVESVPLAPEAVQLLALFERADGRVFRPLRQDGTPMTPNTHRTGLIISKIGKAAGVVVNTDTGKCASAHDLRRAFGQRWSKLLMPAQLKALMRHASIETTMTYYVGQRAQSAAKELWAALGKQMGKQPAMPESKIAANP